MIEMVSRDKNKLKVAIVGTNKVSELHLEAHQTSPLSEVAALCGVDKDRTKELTKKWDVNKCYSDYRQILEEPEIEAVEIVDLNPFDEEMALQALQAGKDISLDLNIFMKLENLDALKKKIGESHRKFYIYVPSLFHPPLVRARELIKKRVISEPSIFRMKSFLGGKGGWEVDFPLRDAVLTQALFQGLAIAYFFFGKIEKIFSWKNRSSLDKKMSTVSMWKFQKPGKYGFFESDYSPEMKIKSFYYPWEEKIEIIGGSGVIWINKFQAQMLNSPSLFVYRKDKAYYTADPKDEWKDAFLDCTKNFIKYIKKNKKPTLSLEECCEILRWISCAEESQKNSKEVLV